MNSQFPSRNPGIADWIVATAKKNPEGLLLLAAGAALLARTSRPSTGSGHPRRGDDVREGRPYEGSPYEGSSGASSSGSRSWPGAERMSQAVDTARQTAADMGSRVTETASSVADTASSYAASASRFATETTRTVRQRSGDFYEDATSTLQGTVQRVMREQPLMVALAGLAAGAAVAAAFPRTEIEERTLGPAGERITDLASQKAEQVKAAGAAAGQRLMSSAEQRGLSAEGLKDLAREAVDAFGQSMSQQGSGAATGSGSGSGTPAQPKASDDMGRRE
jgi:hypothetical protein